ncbi:universal stress protein [Caldimonas tepidiphila]|uniref:universal stress protein n=1 Tax=Caldimonas tepidiphila TaxID=2315841 RepID=UPI000E5A2D78|nr:universal stress protein [Caldimonas tepidiphila]
MDKVIACIADRADGDDVCAHAAWAATRLGTPLELLHVLDRHPETAPVQPQDLSGSIGVDAQEALLAQLATLDEQRARVAMEHGRLLLQSAREAAERAGVAQVETRQRHGALVDTLLELEPGTRLFVLGAGRHHREDGPGGRLHLDHRLERVVRAVQRPVLVASRGSFTAPASALIAFDGSATGRAMVERVAASPLLRGLPLHVVMAGGERAGREALDWARARLEAAGFDAQAAQLAGEAETAIGDYQRRHGLSLLVMGAYGHSRIRQLIVGSTTTTMLRTSAVPVLILR